MGFSNFEFPHTNYYDDDLRELLRLYRELKAEYDGLQADIAKVTKAIEDFYITVDAKIDERIDVKMGILSNRVANLDTEVAKLGELVTSNTDNIEQLHLIVRNLDNDLSAEIAEFKGMINDVYEVFAEYKHSIDSIVNVKVQELETYIKEQISHIDRLYVNNPLTGKREGIQKVLDDIASQLFATYGLTAKEYDNLNLKAREYDNMRITAQDYDLKGYFIFFRLMQLNIRNPFTGLMDSIEDVIYMLTNLHRDVYTASQYDDLQMSASDYDSLFISAFEYDFHNRKLFDLWKNSKAPTATEYDGFNITADKYDSLKLSADTYDEHGNIYIQRALDLIP